MILRAHAVDRHTKPPLMQLLACVRMSGVEMVGGDSPIADAEVIAMAHESLVALGITGTKLEVNTLGGQAWCVRCALSLALSPC